jgi:radical SAM superfamily enzyme with C-terminal helix-hairpin-helix motif
LSTQTGDILQKLAKRKPDQLIGVVENLYQLWLKNAYIGGISEIFSSYQYIDGEPLRNEVKVRFQEFYQQMKKINPKLQDVEWK